MSVKLVGRSENMKRVGSIHRGAQRRQDVVKGKTLPSKSTEKQIKLKETVKRKRVAE